MLLDLKASAKKLKRKRIVNIIIYPESVVRPEGGRHLAGGNPVWKGLTSHQ